MSVSDNQDGSEVIFNAAFISKTDVSGNVVTGKIDLQNASAESGANITNAQKVINQEAMLFRTVQTVTAAGQIDIDEKGKNHIVLVVGDAGNVTSSTTPFNPENGGSFLDGTVITVIGTNQSQKVKIPNTAKATNVTRQNGDADLGEDFSITYMRVTMAGTSYWLERSRNS